VKTKTGSVIYAKNRSEWCTNSHNISGGGATVPVLLSSPEKTQDHDMVPPSSIRFRPCDVLDQTMVRWCVNQMAENCLCIRKSLMDNKFRHKFGNFYPIFFLKVMLSTPCTWTRVFEYIFPFQKKKTPTF
jgi:hypothetical protein